MANRTASWFRTVAAGGVFVSLAAVVAMEELQSASLPLWAHIPLTLMVLGLLSLGALAAGTAYAEYQMKLVSDRQKAH